MAHCGAVQAQGDDNSAAYHNTQSKPLATVNIHMGV